MSEQQTEAGGPDGSRVVVQYVGPEGADESPVSLPGYLGALPSIVKPGDLFTALVEYAAELDGQAEFEVGDEIPATHPDFTEAVRSIAGEAHVAPAVPLDLARADKARAEAEAADLKGDDLTDALRERGLPLSGTADEKRARIAEHDAGQQSPPPPPPGEGDQSNPGGTPGQE